MKCNKTKIAFSLLFIGLLFACNRKTKTELSLQSIFINDSGYIDKQSLLFMFPNIDSISFEYFDSDKYGKYFKDTLQPTRYVALVFNPCIQEYTANQIVEVNLSSNQLTSGERLSAWWYSPDEQIENFTIRDGYYYLPTCIGHGSAFNAMGFYLFQDIQAINTPIHESVYSGNPPHGFSYLFMQNLLIRNDTLTIDYEIENGIYEEINGVDSCRTTSTHNWKINYHLINKEWQATDSTMFHTTDYIFM